MGSGPTLLNLISKTKIFGQQQGSAKAMLHAPASQTLSALNDKVLCPKDLGYSWRPRKHVLMSKDHNEPLLHFGDSSIHACFAPKEALQKAGRPKFELL